MWQGIRVLPLIKKQDNLWMNESLNSRVTCFSFKVLMTEEKFEEAETISESLLLLSPDFGLPLMGKIKILQNKFAEAKEILLKAVKVLYM